MRSLKLTALALCLLAILSSSCPAVQILGGRTYTLDADWNEGTMNRVTHDPNHDQLQLSPPSQVDMAFIWTPNNDSTISRVDVETGLEVGRYRVGPESRDASPSRTTVDQDGNCWVGCRGLGTVVKVGVQESGEGLGWIDRNSNSICDTCVDANADGVINGTEVLPFGDDECVLFEVLLSDDQYRGTYVPNTCKDQGGNYVYTTSIGPRGLAIDSQNNLWAGTYGTRKYFYIRGDNGQIQEVVDFAPMLPLGMDHHPYGAVIDPNGVLWSSGCGANTIMKLDPRTSPVTCTFRDLGHYVYGLGMDSTGHLFVTGHAENRISRISVGNPGIDVEWTRTNLPLRYAKGVCCTPDGDVWVATSEGQTVVHLNNDCTVAEEQTLYGEPTGVAVDHDGYVWVVGNTSPFIRKIDPATNMVVLPVDLVGTQGHYGYSDMTGYIAQTINNKRKGTWTAVYDSNVEGASWGVLHWNCYQAPGTSVKFRVRSSVDNVNWSNWESINNHVTLSQVPDGRYLKVEASLETIVDGNTPILRDVSVNYVNAFIVVPTSLSVPEGGENTFQVKLKAAPTSNWYANITRITGGDPDLYVKSGPYALYFSTANWDTFQTATLGAGEDSDLANGTATFRIWNNEVRSREVVATELDNDTLPFADKWGAYGSNPGSFNHPMDVACDSQGYVYVADTQNYRIQKFSPLGEFVLQWGSYGTGDGQFDQPCGICVGRAGHIFVADTYNDRIQEFLPDGTYLGKIGNLSKPWGVGADSEGRLFMTDTYSNHISRYVWHDYEYGTDQWLFDASWGGTGSGDGHFRYPEGIAIDAIGNMYVADTYNQRIQVLNNTGQFVAKWGSLGSAAGQFSYPKGVCFDPTYSNLFVSDTYNNRIQTFVGSQFISQWGSFGSGDGQFECPGGLACDPAGNLYVADTENHRIQKFGWTLNDFRGVPNFTHAAFGPVAVTAVFPSLGCVYVETLDRTTGIRINTTGAFSVGQLVEVRGVVRTYSDYYERYIDADAGWPIIVDGASNPAPIGMSNEWLVETANNWTPIAGEGLPFYSAGLLVQTWGTVIAANPTSGLFYITDGSGAYLDVSIYPGTVMPTVGEFVKVVGINTKTTYKNVLRMRSADDITTVTEWDSTCIGTLVPGDNYLSLPGIPRYPEVESVFVGCPDTPGIPLEDRLSGWYAPGQNWQTYSVCPPTDIPTLIAQGYCLTMDPDWSDSYYYERTPATGDQVISLPVGSTTLGSGSLIGNPFDTNRAWSSILAADGKQWKTLADAIASGWIHEIRRWTGSSWATVDVSTENMETKKAYWVYPKRSRLALIVPAP